MMSTKVITSSRSGHTMT